MEDPLQLRIRDINPHIVCSLCAGYYIEATTVTECLHTFCKSCIVKFLQSSKSCPQCNTKIHETQPVMKLKADRVMQDIVFKLVPGLYETEEKRKLEFYKSRGLVKEQKQREDDAPPALTSVYDNPYGHYYKYDQLICLCLERFGLGYVSPPLPKKFVRCSVRTCVQHVKLLLRRKLGIPSNLDIDIVCKESILDKFMTMKQVWLLHWQGQPSPMMLYYLTKPREQLQT